MSAKPVSGSLAGCRQPDRTYQQCRMTSGSRLYIADIETLDEPVLYLEDVDHHSVGQEIAL